MASIIGQSSGMRQQYTFMLISLLALSVMFNSACNAERTEAPQVQPHCPSGGWLPGSTATERISTLRTKMVMPP